MSFNCYAGIRNGRNAHERRVSVGKQNNDREKYPGQKETKPKSVLETRLKVLLEKYENDKETQDKILGELNLYRINITIARELNDKNTEKNLTREFMKFLNQF